MNSSMTAAELIAWNDATARQWQELCVATPAILNAPCDIAGSGTCGGLLRHVAVTELRYAELLAGLAAGDYTQLPASTSEQIFAIHDHAIAVLRTLVEDPAIDWTRKIEFPTLTAGRRRASRRAILFHAMLHSIRHYAQLGTAMRRAGFEHHLKMDYLLMDSEPA
jgi:uncharacterized damage-inducible protein DinB